MTMEEKSRKPEDTPFKQQKLKSWQPILTPNWVIGTFFVVGLIFIPIGAILQFKSDEVVEYSIQYDGSGYSTGSEIRSLGEGCQLQVEKDGNKFNIYEHGCFITFDIQKDMEAPIYVYYQLDNFYQNHRRYVASRSDTQLLGQDNPSIGDCDPLKKASGYIKYNSTDSTPLNTNEDEEYTLNPCGLIANSLFNDIFWVHSIDDGTGIKYAADDVFQGTPVNQTMSQEGVAWKSDIDNKYKNYQTYLDDNLYLWQNPNYRFIIPARIGQEAIPNVTAWTTPTKSFGVLNEHFIVWMRTAGLPNFRKLYGRIDTPLKEGTRITFLVSSNFVVGTFDGKKSLVISTTSWFGGKNPFLGIAYITVGSLCMVLAILFFAKHKLSPRKLGDTRYLVWKNRT